MNIAVLMGGVSPEREVSLRSGKAISSALQECGHKVVELDWAESDVLRRWSELTRFDLIFIGYHGGWGEDGHIQSVLEMLDIPYTGSSSLASSLSMNKIYSKRIFNALGLNTPPGFSVENRAEMDIDKIDERIKAEIGYPVIIKPATCGSTLGLSYVEASAELAQAIAEAHKYSYGCLVEKYIPGRELTVSILGTEPLPVVEIVPSHGLYDYTCKYTKGMSRYICPAELDEAVETKIKHDALVAYNGLGCSGYGRVDFRYDGQKLYCLEVNTLPGMTELSLVPMAAKAKGLTFVELIERILEEALKRKEQYA
jgi:D-alanine-D-alanine ligase